MGRLERFMLDSMPALLYVPDCAGATAAGAAGDGDVIAVPQEEELQLLEIAPHAPFVCL
jgi:hypothetical protein